MEPDVPGGSGPLLGGKNASLLSSLKSGPTSLLGEPHYRGDKEVSCVGEGDNKYKERLSLGQPQEWVHLPPGGATLPWRQGGELCGGGG